MKNKLKYVIVYMLGIASSLLMTNKCFAGTAITKNITESKKTASFKDVTELSKIIETINLVEESWVGDKNPSIEDHYAAAISGIMNALDDPYSVYLDSNELKDMNEDIGGTYSGVGMSIQKKKGEYMEVISPFIGSPAFKANIQIGDKISKIDGKDITDKTATETSKMLRGPKGTKVEVEIIRQGLKKPIKITLIRDNIKLENVEYKMIDNEIGYISLLKFGTGIAEEIENAIKDLNKKGMKKLILDLRTNPGGVITEAVDLASLFTKEKKMVSLKYKNGQETVYNRTKSQVFSGKMVILINRGSASASEILSGILKDYNRATLIGDRTYGKGVAQSIIEFKTGDALKVTIAKYSTPKNDNINKVGIEPNIYKKMEALLSSKGYANETEKAKENRIKEIEKLLVEVHGKEKADEYIKAGDVQLKSAIDFLQGKKVVSDTKEEK